MSLKRFFVLLGQLRNIVNSMQMHSQINALATLSEMSRSTLSQDKRGLSSYGSVVTASPSLTWRVLLQLYFCIRANL